MELVLLEVLQQHTAGAVHDALGHAGGARAEQHVPRVVERQLFELDRSGAGLDPDRACPGDELVPPHRVGHRVAHRRTLPAFGEATEHHHAPQRRKRGADLGESFETIEGLAAVAVPIGGEEHHRFELPETVDHPVDAEIRRGGTEHRSDRGGSEHGDHRLGDVGHPGSHPIADAHTLGPERSSDLAHRGPDLVAGEHAGAVRMALVDIDEHRGITRRAATVQDRLGDVESRVGEELRGGHGRAAVEHPLAPGADDAGGVPHRRPELLGFVHAPAVQCRVVGESLRGHEPCHLRVGHVAGRRHPQGDLRFGRPTHDTMPLRTPVRNRSTYSVVRTDRGEGKMSNAWFAPASSA